MRQREMRVGTKVRVDKPKSVKKRDLETILWVDALNKYDGIETEIVALTSHGNAILKDVHGCYHHTWLKLVVV